MRLQNNFYVNVAVSLSMLVPVPARFAYGLILVVVFNLLILFGTLFKRLTEVLNIEKLQKPLLIVLLVSIVMFVNCLLIYYNAFLSLTLNFVLFLPVFSSLVVGQLFSDEHVSLARSLKKNMLYCGVITVITLSFLFLRELLAYGSVTIPLPGRMLELSLFPADTFAPSLFLITIPGGIVLAALLITALSYLKRLISIGRGR